MRSQSLARDEGALATAVGAASDADPPNQAKSGIALAWGTRVCCDPALAGPPWGISGDLQLGRAGDAEPKPKPKREKKSSNFAAQEAS